MPLLQNGDAFPKLIIPAVGGGAINLPDALAGSWGAVADLSRRVVPVLQRPARRLRGREGGAGRVSGSR